MTSWAYAGSLLLALAVLAVALGLVVLQRRLRPGWRGAVVGLIFLAGIATRWALAADSAADGRVSLQQALGWAYDSLIMFAGNGAIDVVEAARTPGGLPLGGVQVAHYLVQVLAFLFTVSAVVAALARAWLDRVVVGLTSYDEVHEVHGRSAEALLIASSLAAAPARHGRRLVAVVDESAGEEPSELGPGLTLVADPALARRKLAKAGRGSVFLVDSGQPQLAETVAAEVARLSEAGHDDVTLLVVTSSAATRDLVAAQHGPVEVRCIELAELAARNLVRRFPPVAVVAERGGLREGVADRPFRALVLAEGGPLLERVLEQLSMHAQLLGGRPRLAVLAEAPAAASFVLRHPEIGESADLDVRVAGWGTPEAYAVVADAAELLDQVVVAFPDEARGVEVAHDVRTFLRLHRPDAPLPRILVRGDSEASAAAGWGFFGSQVEALSAGNLLDEAGDALARRVNAHYCGIDPAAPSYDADSRAAWRPLTWVNRASSRASADFLPSMLRVWDSAEALADAERLELAAMTEHLRWNAFYRSLGYQRMSSETMAERFEEARLRDPEGGPEAWGRHARDDSTHRRHVCLVPWEDLPAVDRAYNELHPDLRRRDFQQSDRDVLRLLQAVGGARRDVDA